MARVHHHVNIGRKQNFKYRHVERKKKKKTCLIVLKKEIISQHDCATESLSLNKNCL